MRIPNRKNTDSGMKRLAFAIGPQAQRIVGREDPQSFGRATGVHAGCECQAQSVSEFERNLPESRSLARRSRARLLWGEEPITSASIAWGPTPLDRASL